MCKPIGKFCWITTIGVLSIGVCSIFIILLIFSNPKIFLYFPIGLLVLLILFCIISYKMFSINFDFPLPETPKINTKFPNGIFTFIFFIFFSYVSK